MMSVFEIENRDFFPKSKRMPDQEVDQRKLGQRLCKKLEQGRCRVLQYMEEADKA